MNIQVCTTGFILNPAFVLFPYNILLKPMHQCSFFI